MSGNGALPDPTPECPRRSLDLVARPLGMKTPGVRDNTVEKQFGEGQSTGARKAVAAPSSCEIFE